MISTSLNTCGDLTVSLNGQQVEGADLYAISAGQPVNIPSSIDSEFDPCIHSEELKAKIRMTGKNLTAIAEELDMVTSSVSAVVSGRSRSARVENHIAELLNMPAEKLFPRKTSVLRRTKAQMKATAHAADARKSA